MKIRLRAIAFLSISLLGVVHLLSQEPDVVLEGKILCAQNKTYIEVPFDVPNGIHRISVDVSYTGKDQRTVLDLGIADPHRFRGNSGGNKSHFTIGESDATPSYSPGAIVPGKWKLLISVPNIRATETTNYRAEVRFNSPAEDQGFSAAPLATGKRWYRGDLHMHTGHRDGSCKSQSGKRVPCPVFLTAQTATLRGLDFIAVSDHNATSQYNAMRELQPYFDHLSLIPGREITTFGGHFNIFGDTQYVDYRVVAANGRDINDVLREVRAHGGIASINHGVSPGGEICMGCAWEPQSSVDMSLLTGIEVVNGGRIMLSSADFWDREIGKGVQLTAIGGSDNHDARSSDPVPGAIGHPTTVVEANELSVPAILASIRKGRVFIDLTSSRDKVIDLKARRVMEEKSGEPDEWTRMGDNRVVDAGGTVEFQVDLENCPASSIHLFLDGHENPELAPLSTSSGTETLPFKWKTDDKRHWIRAEVRDSKGSLTLISNPIYIVPAGH